MNADQIEKLKALALAATKGPWKRSERPNGPFWHISSEHTVGGQKCLGGRQAIGSIHAASKRDAPEYAAMFQANADFVAECHPAAVLELIAEVERLRAEAGRYRWLRDKSEPGICAFYLSVGQAFKGVKFARETVDEAIDAAIEAHSKAGTEPA